MSPGINNSWFLPEKKSISIEGNLELFILPGGSGYGCGCRGTSCGSGRKELCVHFHQDNSFLLPHPQPPLPWRLHRICLLCGGLMDFFHESNPPQREDKICVTSFLTLDSTCQELFHSHSHGFQVKELELTRRVHKGEESLVFHLQAPYVRSKPWFLYGLRSQWCLKVKRRRVTTFPSFHSLSWGDM